MSQLRIALIGLFPLAFLASCDDEVEPVFIEIPGKLKKEMSFEDINGEYPMGFTEYKYGENGKVLEEHFYEYPDYQHYFIRKEYDNRDRLIRETSYTNEFGEFLKGSYSVFEYDEQDRLKKMAGYYGDRLNHEVFYEYDEQGRKVKESLFQPEHDYVDSYEIFTYREDGLPYRDSAYNYDDLTKDYALSSVYEYEYDEDGKLIKRWIIDGISNKPPGFEPGVEEEFIYNQEGVLIESRRYDPYVSYLLLFMIRYEYY